MKKWFKYTFILLVLCLFGLSLGCQAKDDSLAAPRDNIDNASIQVVAQSEPLENIDVPQLSDQDVCIMVWSMLETLLPDDYKIEQFNRSTCIARYVSNGSWAVSINGSRETKSLLPQEMDKSSDIRWIIYHVEQATTYKLCLWADYHEDEGACEILGIEDYDAETSVIKTLYNELHAELELLWLKFDWLNSNPAINYCPIAGQVRNNGQIPLYNIKAIITSGDYSQTPRLHCGEPGERNIPTGQLARFECDWQCDKPINIIKRLQFVAVSGEIVPHTIGDLPNDIRFSLERPEQNILTPWYLH